MNFIHLSHDGVTLLIAIFQLQYCKSSSGNEVNCLHVTICSKLVHCHWCISIFIIIPVVRWFSLIGPHWSAVVLFDHGYPSFGNFDSTIPINVVGMKSYMDSLCHLTCVPVESQSINLTLLQIGICPISLACSKTTVWENCMSLSCYFILYPLYIDLLVLLIYSLPHSHGIL